MTNVKIYISGAQGPAGDSPTSIATTIHAATSKTTPADLDELGIADSAASFGLKKLTWANLKTALSTALQSVFYTETETNALLNAKANLAGGNTFTGTQTINVGAFKDTTTTNTSSISATANTLTASRTVTLPNASGVMALTTNANGSTSDIELYAKAGLAINAAQVVYITGATGVNVIIGLAQANDEATSSRTIGICKQNLANNGFGYVVTEGNLTGISVAANGAVEGDPVFLSPTTPGGMVFGLTNKPSAPNHLVYLGVIKTISGLNVTAIYVKVQNGYELNELSDVAISSPTSGQSLFRNGSNLWVNRAIVSADVSDASTGGNGSIGDGGKLVKFNSGGGITTLEDGYGYGVYASSNMGNGLIADSQDGNGALISSNSSNGINVISASGTYHALFGDTASDRSFIARVNGALGWFRGVFTGRIIAPATLAADVTWTLPTTGGNLAIVASAAGTIVSADVSDAAEVATANTVVKRGSAGQASFAASGISGGPAVSASASSLQTAIIATATSGPALRARSESGNFHAYFGGEADDTAFVARSTGAFGWYRGFLTARIRAQAVITTDQFYSLPDATGTVPIVPEYASLAAANAALPADEFYWDTTDKKLRVTTA